MQFQENAWKEGRTDPTLYDPSGYRQGSNNSFSRRSSIEYGVPQWPVLGSLLFNIDLTDLFYECEASNIANYAGNTTPYACEENIRTVISELQSLAFTLFKWFENKHMRDNPGKSHILVSNKYLKMQY